MAKGNPKTNRNNNPNKNPLETLGDIGDGMLDQFFGYNEGADDFEFSPRRQEASKKQGKKEVKLFNYP